MSTASNISITEQFDEILKEYKTTLDKEIEDALTEIGNDLISDLSLASPVHTPGISEGEKHFKDCWAMKTKYHGVRYIGNTKKVHDGIPLSNLIEFGSKGKPFIERTFNTNKQKLFTKFIQILRK